MKLENIIMGSVIGTTIAVAVGGAYLEVSICKKNIDQIIEMSKEVNQKYNSIIEPLKMNLEPMTIAFEIRFKEITYIRDEINSITDVISNLGVLEISHQYTTRQKKIVAKLHNEFITKLDEFVEFINPSEEVVAEEATA